MHQRMENLNTVEICWKQIRFIILIGLSKYSCSLLSESGKHHQQMIITTTLSQVKFCIHCNPGSPPANYLSFIQLHSPPHQLFSARKMYDTREGFKKYLIKVNKIFHEGVDKKGWYLPLIFFFFLLKMT